MRQSDEPARVGEVAAEAPPAADGHNTDLETVLRPRASPRRRLMTALLVVGVLLLAVGFVLRDVVSANVTPLPAPGPRTTVMVVSNVSYGVVSLNGKRLAASSLPVSLLRDGDNTLMLDAPPFQVPPCVVSWPLTSAQQPPQRGDCLVSINSADRLNTIVTIEVFAGSYDLPADLRASALAAVAASYASASGTLPVATVPPGDYFATGFDARETIQSQRATTPLVATLAFEPGLITDPVLDPELDQLLQPCWQLACPGDTQASTPGPSRFWYIGDAATLVWHFTDEHGHVVASARYVWPAKVNLTLTPLSDGRWVVTHDSLGPGQSAAPAASVCALGMSALRAIPGYEFASIDMLAGNAPGAAGAGCALRQNDPQGGVAGTFIWRFGVLLASDSRAHLLVPWLPQAPADEVLAVSSKQST